MLNRIFSLAIKLCAIVLVSVSATQIAEYLRPSPISSVETFDISTHLPKSFGNWKKMDTPFLQVSLLDDNAEFSQPYDVIEMTSYENTDGMIFMLALAWGKEQQQEIKLHQPPLCYKSQGFSINRLVHHEYKDLAMFYDKPVKGINMLAENHYGAEAVSYWMRIGSLFSQSGRETRIHIFEQGIKGNIPDGILVRASLKVPPGMDEEQAFSTLDSFLFEFVKATSVPLRELMLGSV